VEGFAMTTAPPESRSLDWITRLISLDTTSRNSNLELIDLVAGEMRRHGHGCRTVRPRSAAVTRCTRAFSRRSGS